MEQACTDCVHRLTRVYTGVKISLLQLYLWDRRNRVRPIEGARLPIYRKGNLLTWLSPTYNVTTLFDEMIATQWDNGTIIL